jgi:hypothetical protein
MVVFQELPDFLLQFSQKLRIGARPVGAGIGPIAIRGQALDML